MPSITLATQTVATQTGTAVPTIPTTVLTNSLSALDTTASNGPGSNLDNTALPLFGCRAFVNFDGTSTTNVTVDGATEAHCAIRSSGNVSKVVKSSVGIYVIHFITAMPDSNYACVATSDANPSGWGNSTRIQALSTTNFTIRIVNSQVSGSGADDGQIICMSIFR